MKNHDFYLNLADKKGREGLFQKITNMKDFLTIKLIMMELLFSQWDNSCNKSSCTVPYLHIDDYDLHRAFIVSNNKIISFGFSFTLILSTNHIEAFYFNNTRINAKHISEAQTILRMCDDVTLYKDIEEDDLEQPLSHEGKKLFEYLLFEEPAYIRYDYDKQTKTEILHPKHHLDVCFTPNFSYKFGLSRKINESEYLRILNNKEFCRKLNLNIVSNRFQKGNYSKRKFKVRKKHRM